MGSMGTAEVNSAWGARLVRQVARARQIASPFVRLGTCP